MKSVSVPFVGPSYTLANRKADVQRSVNLYLEQVESGSGKAQSILKSVPGLSTYQGTITGEVRGFCGRLDGYAFAVVDNDVYQLAPSLSTIATNLLSTSTGPVSMALGRDEIVVVDGSTHIYRIFFTAV